MIIINIEVNYLAVLVAAIVSMVIGFLWYGPILGKTWMRLKGLSEESLKEAQASMGRLYALSFVAALISAYVLSHVITLSMNFYNYEAVQTGITSGFWMWLGFVLPVQLTAAIFGDKNWKLLGVDTGYQLVSLMAMGLVLGLI